MFFRPSKSKSALTFLLHFPLLEKSDFFINHECFGNYQFQFIQSLFWTNILISLWWMSEQPSQEGVSLKPCCEKHQFQFIRSLFWNEYLQNLKIHFCFLFSYVCTHVCTYVCTHVCTHIRNLHYFKKCLIPIYSLVILKWIFTKFKNTFLFFERQDNNYVNYFERPW